MGDLDIESSVSSFCLFAIILRTRLENSYSTSSPSSGGSFDFIDRPREPNPTMPALADPKKRVRFAPLPPPLPRPPTRTSTAARPPSVTSSHHTRHSLPQKHNPRSVPSFPLPSRPTASTHHHTPSSSYPAGGDSGREKVSSNHHHHHHQRSRGDEERRHACFPATPVTSRDGRGRGSRHPSAGNEVRYEYEIQRRTEVKMGIRTVLTKRIMRAWGDLKDADGGRFV